MLTGDTEFAIVSSHTVTENNNTTNKMKSKTLLIAAAALVAATVSSQAQVYSANIVGYANVTFPANTLVLAATPLDDGTNTANDLLASLPNKSSLETWNGSGFTVIAKTSSGFAGNPYLPPGTGYFVKSVSAYTNTYVGNVVPAPGGNSSTNILPANALVLVGSILPVSGTFNDVGTNTVNLIATLPNKSSLETWNGSGFTVIAKTSSGFAGSPALSVGQGFFVKSVSATNWVQTLQ
jgi:hypothetical protein